ncbi:MAG: magnesium transporter, MgtE [Cytophagaceae bacterium]|jgi:magnesium transporter|nr:magnesium transporter, MgtE [Cytophagaceae bacterium]
MAFEMTEKLLEELIALINAEKSVEILEVLQDFPEQDISVLLLELEYAQSAYVLRLQDTKTSAQVVRELDPDYRKRLLKEFSSQHIAAFIEFLESDDAVDIINEQPVKTGEEVIALLTNKEKALYIRDLLHYDDDCAGGLMAKELVKANINWTIRQTIEEIRKQTRAVNKMYSVYVVDDIGRLIGRVSLKKIILADDHTLISDIYDEEVVAVESYLSDIEVAELMSKYDLEAVPVVNIQGQLLGRITIDDIVDVITEQADQERQAMAGISDDVEEDDNVWLLSKSRLPWLIIGMAGGVAGSRFLGLFENLIALVPAMAFFIPLITATGGNVGIQSSSLVVQSLAGGGDDSFSFARFFKSFVVSLINGLVLAVLVFGMNYIFGEETRMVIVVSAALMGVVVVASFLGTITPLILDRFGVNPAIASGPFITTANDLIGLAIYFSLAYLLY